MARMKNLMLAVILFLIAGFSAAVHAADSLVVFKSITEMRKVSTRLLDAGSIYALNTSDAIVQYKWVPASTATDDSVTAIQRTGTASGRFILYYESYVLANWFGLDATGNRDCSYEMQKCINFVIRAGKVAKIKVLGGIYKLKNIGVYKDANRDGEYEFVSLAIEGSAPVHDISNALGATTIFKNVDPDAVGLFIQMGRNIEIRNIMFYGPLAGPNGLTQTVEFADADWLAGGVRNNQLSPQCAVGIDLLHNNVPASSRYPGLAPMYTNKARSGTSGVMIVDCGARNNNVAVMVSSNGATQNCDNISWLNGVAYNDRIFWASGQTQSRANYIQNIYSFGNVQYFVNCVAFGNGRGTAPNIIEPNIAGGLKYLVYGHGNFGSMSVRGGHMESIWSLGIYSTEGISFMGCNIRLALPDEGVSMAPVIGQGDNWNFIGGSLDLFDNEFKGAVNFNVSNLSFSGTYIRGSQPANKIGTTNRISYEHAIIKNYVGEYTFWDNHILTELARSDINGSPITPGMRYSTTTGELYTSKGPALEYLPGDNKKITINNDAHTAYFRSDNPWKYVAGLTLIVTNSVDYANDIYAPSATVIGYVSSVRGDTVKLAYIPYGLNNTTTYAIKIHHTPQAFVRVVGDITKGSDVITNVAAEIGQHFYPGSLIRAGESLLFGTRVTYVDIQRGTIGISTAAAATARFAQLYDADILKTAYAYQPAAAGGGSSGWFHGDVVENDFSVASTTDTARWYVTAPGFYGTATPPQTKAIVIGSSASARADVTGGATVSSGTYTPTLTAVKNIDVARPAVCQYQRIGNIVTVSGEFQIDAKVAGAMEVGISLPVASGFAASSQAGGSASNGTAVTGRISADIANARARLTAIAMDGNNSTYSFMFTYTIVPR